jgi:Tfp pilus assembly protein PilX
MISKSNKQYGAVSLFVVVFAALLITVLTVSFVRVMVQDQQQATSNDLARSALDSAQAGVEDAKRAILRLQSVCDTGTAADCITAQTQVGSATCNDSVDTLSDINVVGNEVKVETGGANNLNQAYTCVKVTLNTDDYIGELGQDDNKLVPLIGVSDFNRIKIEWFSTKDLQSSTTTANIPGASATPLLNQSSWTTSSSPNRPSIMRVQLIEFRNSGFYLDDFEGTAGSRGSSNTLFLYPSSIVDTVKSFSSNVRKTATVNPTLIHCNNLSGAEAYACSATITLPEPVVGDDHTTYLNVMSLYKKANYRITLLNNASLVKFKGVQSEIDSTGRANDYFKRVSTRVELTDINFPYPTSAVDTTGNLCKDFRVTDKTSDYLNNCTP